MADDEHLLEVGRIHKPHGVRGDLLVSLVTDVEARLAVGSVLSVDPAPPATLEVAAARPHQDRFIVHFVGVDDRTAADELRGRTLLAAPIDDDEALWIHELFGARVVSVDGVERGTVVAVIDNPAADLLELGPPTQDLFRRAAGPILEGDREQAEARERREQRPGVPGPAQYDQRAHLNRTPIPVSFFSECPGASAAPGFSTGSG